MGEPTDCLNCGTALAGRWCHACGQKRLEPEDRTVRRLLGDFAAAVTNLDGRVLRSLRRLILQPGRFARDYTRGVRQRYLSPITLFLFANVLYFFAPTLTDFTPTLREHLELQAHSGIATELVEQRLAGGAHAFGPFEARFERRQNDLAKTLLFLHVPVFALALWATHFRRGLLFADHMLTGFLVMAFMLLHSLITPHLLELLPLRGLDQATLAWVLRVGLIGPLLVWLAFLLRDAFRQPLWLAALKAVALFAAFILAHIVYRAALFFIVFAAT